MSEVTTGAIALSLITSPAVIPVVVAGAAVVGGIYAAKKLHENYDEMEKEIQITEKRLQWLNEQVTTSPIQVAEEAKQLEKIVQNNDLFKSTTVNLPVEDKSIIATMIATAKSPMKDYIPKYMDEIKAGTISIDNAIMNSAKDLAVSNMNFVSSVVSDAAKATGFNVNMDVISNNRNVYDVVFTDRFGRNLTAYLKLNKELNPSLALDLEGFNKNSSNECSKKMEEIVKYLTEHGVPFTPKKLKHNNPVGVLRNAINKVEPTKTYHKPVNKRTVDKQELSDYLTGNQGNLSSNKVKH
jgi:hypothetical protein